MTHAKSGDGENRRGVADYPRASRKESHRGHESYMGNGDGKQSSEEEQQEGLYKPNPDEQKRQAHDDRVHYRGPRRQLGGYEYPETDTSEPAESNDKQNDDASAVPYSDAASADKK